MEENRSRLKHKTKKETWIKQHRLLSILSLIKSFPLFDSNGSHIGFRMVPMSELQEHPLSSSLLRDWWLWKLEKSHRTPAHLCHWLERRIWSRCGNSNTAFLTTPRDFSLFWLGIQGIKTETFIKQQMACLLCV